MVHRGIATFGLDTGHCPPWLFERMVKLGKQVVEIVVDECGPDEFIKRIAEPGWFQSLGTVLAFDWNASGLTTILTASLKESIRGHQKDLGIYIGGGKGKTSLKTPDDITQGGEILNLPEATARRLVYNSKMAAKVDSSLVQDGFQLYHHAFLFSKNGAWTVVQQGMNKDNRSARRYHWHSENIKDLVVEPHTGIASQLKNRTLDLTAQASVANQKVSTELVGGNLNEIFKDLEILDKHAGPFSQALRAKKDGEKISFLNLENREFKYHPVVKENFAKSKYLKKILYKLTEQKPKNYESLLGTQGVGPKTIRALSLVSEVIYGAKPSYIDPARYSFAHGGKDGTPYLSDYPTYDKTINFFEKVINKMKISPIEKNKLVRKLS